MLLQTQSLDSSVDLEHLGEVDGCLLTNTFVVGVVDVQHSERVVVPVQDRGDDDHAVGVDLVVGEVELFQGFLRFVFVGKQEVFGDGLN